MLIRHKYVSTISNGSVAPAPATIWSITVGTAAAGAILRLYNGQSAVDQVGEFDASQVGSFWLGIYCAQGLFYDLSVGAAKVTIGFG